MAVVSGDGNWRKFAIMTLHIFPRFTLLRGDVVLSIEMARRNVAMRLFP